MVLGGVVWYGVAVVVAMAVPAVVLLMLLRQAHTTARPCARALGKTPTIQTITCHVAMTAEASSTAACVRSSRAIPQRHVVAYAWQHIPGQHESRPTHSRASIRSRCWMAIFVGYPAFTHAGRLPRSNHSAALSVASTARQSVFAEPRGRRCARGAG